ncbi:choice-of-anchor V domain-containing protein [Aliidiomarina sp. Khilg15.8]
MLYRALMPPLAAVVMLPLAALAFPDGPEPGHTGGAGQQDCSACHYAGPAQTAHSGIELHGLAETMVPGDTYQIELLVNDAEQQVGGFQLAIRYRDGSNEGVSAGQLVARDGQQTITDSGIEYLSHDTPQASVSQEGYAQTRWQFEWVAPKTNHAVELAVAAVAANNDNSSLGDNVYQLRRVIEAEQAK